MATYFRNIWSGIVTVLIGMKVTWKHLFTPAVTIQYPEVRLKLPDRARNRLYVNMDDCIGCDQCSMACPVDCITIETIKSTPDVDLGLTSVGTKKRLHVSRFDIDIAKCCYCGLCVPPCPTECIVMTDVYEFSEYQRNNLLYRFATMSPAQVEEARSKLAAFDREQAEKKAAAAAAAAAAKAAEAAKAAAAAEAANAATAADATSVPVTAEAAKAAEAEKVADTAKHPDPTNGNVTPDPKV